MIHAVLLSILTSNLQTKSALQLFYEQKEALVNNNLDLARSLSPQINRAAQAEGTRFSLAIADVSLGMVALQQNNDNSLRRLLPNLRRIATYSDTPKSASSFFFRAGQGIHQLALTQQKQGELALAREYYELSLIRNLSPNPELFEGNTLCAIAESYYQENNHDSAAKTFTRALLSFAKSSPDADCSWGLRKLWPMNIWSNAARNYSETAWSLRQSFSQRTNAETVYQFGRWLSFYYGNHGDIVRHDELVDLFSRRLESLGNLARYAELLNMASYWSHGANSNANAYVFAKKALAASTSINNPSLIERALFNLEMVTSLTPTQQQEALRVKRIIDPRLSVYYEGTITEDVNKKRQLFEEAIKLYYDSSFIIYPVRELSNTYPLESIERENILKRLLSPQYDKIRANSFKLFYELAAGAYARKEYEAAYDYILKSEPQANLKDKSYWTQNVSSLGGQIFEARGNYEGALERYSRSLDVLRYSEDLTKGQSRSSILNTVRAKGARNGRIRCLLALKRPIEAFEEVERGRSISLAGVLAGGLTKFDPSSVPIADLQEYNRGATLIQNLSNEYLFKSSAGVNVDALRSQISDTARKNEFFAEYLAQKYPAKPISDFTTNPKALSALSPGELYVGFSFIGKDRLGIQVLKGGQSKRAFIVLEDSAKTIQSAATKFRDACSVPTTWNNEASRQLYNLLFSKVEPFMKGTTRLVVAPELFLWDVPMAALIDSSGKYLIDRFEITLTPGLTVYQRLNQANPIRPDSRVAVFANPQIRDGRRFGDLPEIEGIRQPDAAPADYEKALERARQQAAELIVGPQQAMMLARGSRPVELPGTQAEADMISQTFQNAHVFTAAACQETEAKKQLPFAKIVHFATHGFYNDSAPFYSGLLLADPVDDQNDGFLTAEELLGAKLNADLVVMSACNSGRGDRSSGEGLLGLSWSLTVAGAKAKILSYWSVDDVATSKTFVSFYNTLKKGSSPEASLRASALLLKSNEQYRHPFFWAPFFVCK